MEESEFAEGEVCYSKDDDTSIGPDIDDLSYIDEKLQNVLGHSQKAFEGEFSAEKLGPKFGGYGSFLPMYLLCPSIWSSSVKVSARQDSCLSSAQVAEKKLPTKQASSLNKLVNPTDRGTLRVRIKVGSDSMTRKKEMQLDSQETSNASPSRILQIMTSSPYPGEPMLSPLHENLCRLSKNTPAPVLRSRQKYSDIPMSDSASKLGNGEGLKKKKSESVGKRETLEESRRGNGTVLEKKRQVNKDWTKDILPYSDLAKERHVRSSCKDISVYHREVGRSKFTRAPFKADFDDFKGARNNLKQNVGPKVQSHGQDKMKIPYATKKSSFEGKKKPEGTQSNGKSASEESLRAAIHSAPTNKKSAPKDVHKVRDLILERKDNPMDRLDRPSGDRANDSNLKAVSQQNAFVDKSKERGSCKRVNKQVTTKTFLKKGLNDGPHTRGLNSDTEMGDLWVCCDHCQKWRLLSCDVKPEQLPEKWLCSMLNWLPGMNRCAISEEETTKYVHELNQLPLPETENQNNFQNGKKRKGEPYQIGYGTTKKIKTLGSLDTDKYWTSEDVVDLAKQDPSPTTGLPTKTAEKDMQNQGEQSYSKGLQSEPKNRLSLISVKKQRDHARVSLDSGSFNMEKCDGREIYAKKRKLKDWQESQHYIETLQEDYGNHPPDGKVWTKDCRDSEFRKEKKVRLYESGGKKNSSSSKECNEAHFQAALKFLQGASLMETWNRESSKHHGEMTIMEIYDTAAKLCKNCAHEYEELQEIAAAALAYKCMEVAYLRVVYCQNSSTNRDQHDLQASLQMVPQVISPSSSASDIDYVNNQVTTDKTVFSKAIGSHDANQAVVPQTCPNFVRLLDFTKDVNSAMEASRKSQIAFAAANVILEEAQNKEGIISLKRVINFSFQDVEELVRLVRLAIEAIGS